MWSRVNYPEQLLTLDKRAIITEKTGLLVRWKDHFATMLNESSREKQHWPKTGCVNVENWLKWVRLSIEIHNRKFPGADRLHPAFFKRGGMRLVEVLDSIVNDALKNLEVDADWQIWGRFGFRAYQPLLVIQCQILFLHIY